MKAWGALYTGDFCSRVYARDEAHRDAVFEARGIGEVAHDAVPYSELEASEKFARAMGQPPGPDDLDAVHALVFLAYLATASGVSTVEDVLHDFGWLHEAVHWLTMRTGPEWTETLARIQAVEQAVPGHLRPSAKTAL